MRHSVRRRSSALAATAAIGALLASGCAVTPPTSSIGAPIHVVAPEPGAPAVTNTQPTVSALAGRMWQTNASVWSLAYSNGILFAGGFFTTLSPPTGVSGASITTGLAAIDTATGSPHDFGSGTYFSHTFNAAIKAMAVSGNTLYVGGNFSVVDGTTARHKLAAFDLADIGPKGPKLLPWNPNVTGQDIRAIAVSGSSVYVGGNFTAVGSLDQPRLAKIDATTGDPDTSWTPDIDSQSSNPLHTAVDALLVSPKNPAGEHNLIVGGKFEHVNGAHLRALATVDLNTGHNGTIDPSLIKTANCSNPDCSSRSDMKALATDGTTVYVGAEGTGGGWFDGTLAFDPVDR